MIYSGNYEKYVKLHRKNIKSISHRSYRKSYKKNDPLEFHPTSPNYDVYYDQSGKLIKAVEYKFPLDIYGKIRDFVEDATYVYTYNHQDQVIHITGFNSITHELRHLADFEYEDGNLVREDVQNIYKNFIDYKEYIHEYRPKYHKLTYYDLKPYFQNLKEGEEEEQEIIIEEFLNDQGLVSEIKYFTELEGLVSWDCNVYNEKGEVIEQYSLDEDQKTHSKYLYTHLNGNLVKYECPSDEKPFYWEYKFELNHKGHWVKEEAIRDAEIRTINERAIEYYL